MMTKEGKKMIMASTPIGSNEFHWKPAEPTMMEKYDEVLGFKKKLVTYRDFRWGDTLGNERGKTFENSIIKGDTKIDIKTKFNIRTSD